MKLSSLSSIINFIANVVFLGISTLIFLIINNWDYVLYINLMRGINQMNYSSICIYGIILLIIILIDIRLIISCIKVIYKIPCRDNDDCADKLKEKEDAKI